MWWTFLLNLIFLCFPFIYLFKVLLQAFQEKGTYLLSSPLLPEDRLISSFPLFLLGFLSSAVVVCDLEVMSGPAGLGRFLSLDREHLF